MTRSKSQLEMSTVFAANVLQRLSDLGWTQTDLAASMDCTPQYISKILSGRYSVGIEVVLKVAGALGCSVADLLMH